MSKVENILKVASKIEDRSLARKIRMATLEGLLLVKEAQDSSGLLSFDNSRVAVDYPSRNEIIRMRAGEPVKEESLYNLSGESKKVEVELPKVQRSLSTRYSPDRVGVQAQRLGDGVVKDPYTGKEYNWKEGFKGESGEEFVGGSVESQSQLHY
jgi:hypothetical protein